MKAKNDTLEQSNAEAKEVKDAAVEETVVEGVRALGEDFNPEVQRSILASMPMSQIRSMKSAYAQIADSKINPSNVNRTQANATEMTPEETKAAEGKRTVFADSHK